jgi:hypothetical protein
MADVRQECRLRFVGVLSFFLGLTQFAFGAFAFFEFRFQLDRCDCSVREENQNDANYTNEGCDRVSKVSIDFRSGDGIGYGGSDDGNNGIILNLSVGPHP